MGMWEPFPILLSSNSFTFFRWRDGTQRWWSAQKYWSWPELYCFALQMLTSEAKVSLSRLTLCDPWTVACQAPLSIEFSRQEYWSGKLFPSPGDLPNPVLYKYFIYYVPGTVLSTLHKSPHLSSKQSYRSNFCFYFKNEGSELSQMLLFLSGS